MRVTFVRLTNRRRSPQPSRLRVDSARAKSAREPRSATAPMSPDSTRRIIATTGTPNAAAMCAGPLSLPMNNCAPAIRLLISVKRRVRAIREISQTRAASSPGPAMNTGSSPRASADTPRPQEIAPPARSSPAPKQTDAITGVAACATNMPRAAAPDGAQLGSRNGSRGTPIQNIALAICSAVCTGRSSPQNLLRPRNLVPNRENCIDDARIPRESARPRPSSAPCCECRRADSAPVAAAIRDIGDAAGQESSSMSGFPSNTARKRSSTTTATLQIGPMRFQQRQRRRGQHAVAQRPQTDHRDPRARRQPLQQRMAFPTLPDLELLFDARLVHQHHGNIVANGIHALALDALQAVLVLLQLHRRLAQRTHQDLQQILTDGHR